MIEPNKTNNVPTTNTDKMPPISDKKKICNLNSKNAAQFTVGHIFYWAIVSNLPLTTHMTPFFMKKCDFNLFIYWKRETFWP